MPRYQLIVLTNAAKGRDEEFNDWYDNQHLGDVLSVPGFVGAQRFRLDPAAGSTDWSYLAIYDMETDDPAKCMAELQAQGAAGKMVMSDAADLSNATVFYATALGSWVGVPQK
jgi:hypothetical protein